MTKTISKVIYGGKTLIDLTSDTVGADKLLSGITAHDKSGALITGTCDFNANTDDATASASEILTGKTAYKAGSKLTGTMKNNGAVTGAISSVNEQYTIPVGYHDGSGKVAISSTEKAKLTSTNIRKGVTVLGVEGSMDGTEGAKPQSVTVAPKTTEQTILPDTTQGYNYLSQVIVQAISYAESENVAGGLTVTIA